MAQIHFPADEDEIIELTDIVEKGTIPPVASDHNAGASGLDFDALLDDADQVRATAAANVNSPDLTGVDTLIQELVAPEQLDTRVEEAAQPMMAAHPTEEIGIEELDDLLGSLEPLRPTPASSPEEVGVEELDNLLDAIINPPPQESTVTEASNPPLQVTGTISMHTSAPEPVAVMDRDTTGMERSLELLAADVAGLQEALRNGQAGTMPEDVLARLSDLQDEVHELGESHLDGLAAAESRITALEKQVEENTGSPAAELAPRLEALEQNLRTLQEQVGATAHELSEVKNRLDTLEEHLEATVMRAAAAVIREEIAGLLADLADE